MARIPLVALVLLALAAPSTSLAATGDEYWGRQEGYPKSHGATGEITATLASDGSRVLALRVPVVVRCLERPKQRLPYTVAPFRALPVRGGRFSWSDDSYNAQSKTHLISKLAGRVVDGGARITGWASFRDTGYGGKCDGKKTFSARRWSPRTWSGTTSTGLPVRFDLDPVGAGKAMTGYELDGRTTWLRNFTVPGVPLACADGSRRTKDVSASAYALLDSHATLGPGKRGTAPAGWKGPLSFDLAPTIVDDDEPVQGSGTMRPFEVTGSFKVVELVALPPRVVVVPPEDEYDTADTYTEQLEPMRCVSEKIAFRATPW